MASSRKRPRGRHAPGALPTLDLLEVERAVRAIRNSGAVAEVPEAAPQLVRFSRLPSSPPRACTPSSSSAAALVSSRASSSSSAWAPSTLAPAMLAWSSAPAAAAAWAPATPALAQSPATPRPAAWPAAAPSTPGGSRPFPAVKPRTRGTAAGSTITDGERDAWLELYESDKLAATSAGPKASQVATWCKFLNLWHGEVMPAIPVEPADIAHVGCIMKAKGYRSLANYISTIKQEHVRAGHAWTHQHELEAKQGVRSATRGQGPPRQSAPLVVDDLVLLTLGADAVVQGGPVNPGGAVFLGAAFLLREIELAYARLAHLHLNTAKLRVSLDLPVSKTDPSAVGCTRVWGCTCQAPMVTGDCVYHAAAAHLAIVHAVLGIASGDPLAQALPLFPDAGGDTVSKAAVVGTIEFIAARLDEPLLDAQGLRRFGGHSMRVTGAQWLGLLGFGIEHIKTFGRWASDTVVRYLGESHVSDLARARRRFIRDQGLLEGHELSAVAASGPSLCTPVEVERIVARAVSESLQQSTARVEELRSHATRYDQVLHEGRRVIHSLGMDLAAPSVCWQTRCGWRFAGTPGWRLASSAGAGRKDGWRECAKCTASSSASTRG